MAALLSRMKAGVRGVPAPSLAMRLSALDRLDRTLVRRKDDIARAVSADFGNRSRHETLLADIFVVRGGIKHVRKHLESWMRKQERSVAWTFLPGSAEVQTQPLGVVGIISPWNYPVQLALGPLVCALAAGNRAMLKPAEFVPRTADLLKEMMAETFPEDEVAVITGGPEVGEAFSRLPFDHLVFTGSTRVGKMVMRAASENLTPVTLELGGKSPAIVGPEMSIDAAAMKIMSGKLFNAGQTCVAPDYVLVPEGKEAEFTGACLRATRELYPTLAENADYTTIINDRHFARLQGLVKDARDKGAAVVELNPNGETLDPKTRKMQPFVVSGITPSMLLAEEEIFGPILGLAPYKTLSEAIAYVNDRPRPLALYYFGHDEANIDRVLAETVSGGVTVNDTMLHVAQDDLPFGGVGPSGMGHYHAQEGFEAMSKKKPIFRQARLNATVLTRPPYGSAVEALLKILVG